MACDRLRASPLWKAPSAVLHLEQAVFLCEDGYTTAAGQTAAQAHYYVNHHQYTPVGSGELMDGGGNYKAGGGDDFLVDDLLLDLGDGAAADDASTGYEGAGGCWGHGKATGSSDSGLTSEAVAEPLVPQVGDITDLEWVSQFVDDCYTYAPPCHVVISPSYAGVTKPSSPSNGPLQFVPNPTSATHSRSPSAGSVTSPVAGVCSLSLKRPWSSALDDPLSAAAAPSCRRARSKRPRAAWGPFAWARSAVSLLQETLCSSASSSSSCSSTSSSFTSRLFLDPYDIFAAPAGSAPRPRGRPPLHKRGVMQHPADQLLLLYKDKPLKSTKKKGRKPKPSSFAFSSPVAAATETATDDSGPGSGRRCSHCGVQKTPQWRAGPMGAKTLCNACGVRYKSGRLLPEYRPACSPTFVSHVHSNSHRKVLEMRRNKELMIEHQHQLLATAAPPPPQQMVC